MAGPLPILLYGATGRAASLILDLARDRGVPLVLGGRDEARLEALARRFGFEARHFDLASPSTIDACLEGTGVVLNCAGPFEQTAVPLVEGCLRTRTHYLDLADDAVTVAAIAARGEEAAARGVMLLPSAGFTSAAPDSIAVLVTQLAPTATRLDLILHGHDGGHDGGAYAAGPRPLVIDRGRLAAPVPRPASRRVELGGRTLLGAPTSHAALIVAQTSTGLADIRCWRVTTRWGALVRDAGRWMGVIDRRGLLATVTAQLGARLTALRRAAGPPAGAEWVAVGSRDGRVLAAVSLEVDSVDRFTAHAALRAALRATQDDAHPGLQTPALCFGPDDVLALPGVKRVQYAPASTAGTRRPAKPREEA